MGTAKIAIRPPSSEAELRERAAWLEGRTIGELAAAIGVPVPPAGARGKGKIGSLVERALGAEAGSLDVPDFPKMGIELKTIPIDGRGVPRESTFVCTISLAAAERADWETSVVRAKLSNVLFVPVLSSSNVSSHDRRIGAPWFWRPTRAQEAVLHADFDDAMGIIGAGGIEVVTARAGRWLQVRAKAATGSVRTICFGPEGEWIATVPRGFYLRASFTRGIFEDPAAMPV